MHACLRGCAQGADDASRGAGEAGPGEAGLPLLCLLLDWATFHGLPIAVAATARSKAAISSELRRVGTGQSVGGSHTLCTLLGGMLRVGGSCARRARG